MWNRLWQIVTKTCSSPYVHELTIAAEVPQPVFDLLSRDAGGQVGELHRTDGLFTRHWDELASGARPQPQT